MNIYGLLNKKEMEIEFEKKRIEFINFDFVGR